MLELLAVAEGGTLFLDEIDGAPFDAEGTLFRQLHPPGMTSGR